MLNVPVFASCDGGAKWHVLKKAKDSLRALYTKKCEYRAESHKVVIHMLIVDEFERGWEMLLDKYKAQVTPLHDAVVRD